MSKAYPTKLYKYLPSRYLDSVMRGELLFRNLSFFKKLECDKRGDPLEAHHRDNPDNDIEIEIVRSGKKVVGDFSFLNSTDSDSIFVFCLSERYDHALYEEFGCDCCIEVSDVGELIRRTRFAVKRLISIHKTGLLFGPINYYMPNRPVELNVKEPKELVFAKEQVYSDQSEYRLVFGTKKAFSLTQSIIINNGYDFRGEAMKGNSKQKTLRIGSIQDITSVRYINT